VAWLFIFGGLGGCNLKMLKGFGPDNLEVPGCHRKCTGH